jgi:hypothetical protein
MYTAAGERGQVISREDPLMKTRGMIKNYQRREEECGIF